MNKIENNKMTKIIEKPLYYNEFNKPEQKRIDSTKVNKRLVNYDRKDEILYLKKVANVLSQISPELFEDRGYSPVQPTRHSTR